MAELHHPIWLYHKDTPGGVLHGSATVEEIAEKRAAGWVDSPADIGSAKAGAPVSDIDALREKSDDDLINAIDDMGRSSVEAHLKAFGRGDVPREARTSTLRGTLISLIRPAMMIDDDDGEPMREPEAHDETSDIAGSLDDMEALEREAFVDTMSRADLVADLKRREVRFPANAGDDRLRASLKALFTE